MKSSPGFQEVQYKNISPESDAKAVLVLQTAADEFERDPGSWQPGRLARLADGTPVPYNSDEAAIWDWEGKLDQVSRRMEGDGLTELDLYIAAFHRVLATGKLEEFYKRDEETTSVDIVQMLRDAAAFKVPEDGFGPPVQYVNPQ